MLIQSAPIVIKLQEPKSDLQGLTDVLIGSLGLAGMFILCAVGLAAVFAGALYLWRRLRPASALDDSDRDLHIV